MYEDLHERGLEIVDIPCNQFDDSAPGSDDQIHEFCSLKYHTRFEQMKKAEVNGENQLPLYAYLKEQKGFTGFGKGPMAFMMKIMMKRTDRNYKKNSDIKWNFTKFIIDRDGSVVARFEPTEDMDKVRMFVEGLI
jgi:glutathione peroxidase